MNETAVKRAQSHGYLLNVKGRIEDTFCYKFFDSYSPYHGLYTILCNLVGHEATWEDLTDLNLEIFSRVIKEKYASASAITYFGYFKTIMFANVGKFDSKKFVEYFEVKSSKKEHVALDSNLIDIIDGFVYSNDYDRYTKNLFMRMILTGARYTDALKFSKDMINTKANTLFYTNYNNVDVSIPVASRLQKYLLEEIPDDMANASPQNWNVRLKNLVMKLPFPETIKSDITFMTAQRTFATYMYRKGLDVNVIMDLMGIQTHRHVRDLIVGYRKKGNKTVLRKVFDEL